MLAAPGTAARAPVVALCGEAVTGPAAAAITAGVPGDQVKIRGFRIELGEIEAVLDPAALRDAAAKVLPGYMIPATTRQRALCDLFAHVLGISQVGTVWNLHVDPSGELHGSVLFNQDEFDESTVAGWAVALRRILAAATREPDQDWRLLPGSS